MWSVIAAAVLWAGCSSSDSVPPEPLATAATSNDRLPTGPPPEVAYPAGMPTSPAPTSSAVVMPTNSSTPTATAEPSVTAPVDTGAAGALGTPVAAVAGAGGQGTSGAAGASGGGFAGAGGASGGAATGGTAGAQNAGGSGGDGDEPLNLAPVTFGPNIKVNDDDRRGQQSEVTMAVRQDGLILAGWLDSGFNPSRCAYSISKDGGESWSANFFAQTQGTGSAFAGDPAVAIDRGGTLYLGCQDYASGGLGTNYILLARSEDDGDTWTDFVRINESLDKPWLAGGENGTVLVSWLGDPGGVKRSTDFGDSFADPITLGFINHGTILAVSDTGYVHMAYNTREDTVTYRRSDDWGESFEAARDLSAQGQACYAPCSPRSHPIVGGGTDPSGQALALTWASRQQHPDAEGDDDVWAIVSYDAGDTFTEPIRVNDNLNESRQFQSWAAADRYGAVHVVWTDLRDNDQNATYYARMVDPEEGFQENVEVTDGTGAPSSFLGDYKGIEVLGRNIVVIWTDTRNDGGDIYFARAEDAAAAGGPLLE